MEEPRRLIESAEMDPPSGYSAKECEDHRGKIASEMMALDPTSQPGYKQVQMCVLLGKNTGTTLIAAP